jgi:hypothetical protein
MPCAELADAIVQSARSTLEWTIRVITNHPTWKAEVVYGDTDSVFVHLPGRNLEQAFKIGEEIAFHMTSNTPEDIVLKFEKVYYPSLLVSKKRYVGNCYEYPPPSPEVLRKVQINPNKLSIPPALPIYPPNYPSQFMKKEFYGKKEILSLLYKYSLQTKLNNYLFIDAKGIEMIRSDQCQLTQKIQKEVLILLFSTFGNLSIIKSYLTMKWNQILLNNSQHDHPSFDPYETPSTSAKDIPTELNEISFKDYIFYRDVRFGTYASVSSQPPGAIVATKEVLQDEMAVPPYNWKVPYVVVYGLPNTPLKNLVYHPKDILKRGNSLRLNYLYYIMKNVNPSLDRLLSLCGVNIFSWFQNMTRPKLFIRHFNYDNIPKELLPPEQVEQQQQQQQSMLLIPVSLQGQPQQQQMSMEQFISQRNCLICEMNLAKSRKLVCEKCLKHFSLYKQQLKQNEPEPSLARRRKRVNEETSSKADHVDSLLSSGGKENEYYLNFMYKFKSLEIKNKIYEMKCQDCVKDTSSHFAAKNTSSHAVQLYQKNEFLGKDHCSNISCSIFYHRLNILLELEEYTLVKHELGL